MSIHDRGFASMDKALQTKIARKSSKTAHALGKAHKYTSDEARKAGRIGGTKRAGRTYHYNTSKDSLMAKLLTILQASLSHNPTKPVSFVTLGNELGISRQYTRTLYYQLKKLYPVPPVGKRGLHIK